MALKLEDGKFYRDAYGNKRGPIYHVGSDYPWTEPTNTIYWNDEGEEEYDGPALYEEWKADAEEEGTLLELNPRPGDVVECVREGCDPWLYGEGIQGRASAKEWCGIPRKYWHEVTGTFRIVSRAAKEEPKEEGPGRTVTRTTREIVPGVYGLVKVEHRVGGCQVTLPSENFFCAENSDELAAAIATLTAIRDALEEQ